MTLHVGLQSMYYKYQYGHNLWSEGKQAAQTQHLDLFCLRNDSAALQVVISSDSSEFLLGLNRDSLFWKAGPILTARIELRLSDALAAEVQPELKLVGLVEDDDSQLKSDILLEAAAIHVEQRRIQPIWLELHASAAANPGTYSGKLLLFTHSLFEDEQLHSEVTFTLTVGDETLPAPQDYRFYLDLWQHNCNIARKHNVERWSDEHYAIMDNYLASMAPLGQKALTILVSEAVWSGQNTHRDRQPSDLFEYSMVPITKLRTGAFVYDFSLLDRYVEMGFRHGIDREIEIFGLLGIWQDPEAGYGKLVEGYPDGVRVRYYDEAAACYRFMRAITEFSLYVQALELHLTERGWIDKVRILADEPADFELFTRSVGALRQLAPSFRYKVAILHADFIRQQIDGVYDYVPSIDCAASESGLLAELKPDIAGKLLFYTSCQPDYPNTFLQSPPTESRMIGWLVERLQLDGYLRWNYTVWPDQPLEHLSFRSPFWKAGDTTFVYPGAFGKPQLSLRYKWLQRGIRDYEYMQQLKRSGRGGQVAEALERVFYFGEPKELLVGSGKLPKQLYSMEPADYDALYKV